MDNRHYCKDLRRLSNEQEWARKRPPVYYAEDKRHG